MGGSGFRDQMRDVQDFLSPHHLPLPLPLQFRSSTAPATATAALACHCHSHLPLQPQPTPSLLHPLLQPLLQQMRCSPVATAGRPHQLHQRGA